VESNAEMYQMRQLRRCEAIFL